MPMGVDKSILVASGRVAWHVENCLFLLKDHFPAYISMDKFLIQSTWLQMCRNLRQTSTVGEASMPNETIRGLFQQYRNSLTPEQAAEILEVSVGTIYRKLTSGDLAGFQIGHQWRIPPSELAKLIEREKR
jgi:excisionase family DNA binding protein